MSVGESCAVDDASRVLAARLARDALAISPDNGQARLLYLTAMLDESAYRRGLDKAADLRNDPAAQAAAKLGVAGMNEVLTYALKNHHVGAEIMAAAILGRIGTARDALRLGAGLAPLVRAAGDSDRRVRMAALEAIVRLQPDGPFPGSSQVLDSLCFFAATGGAAARWSPVPTWRRCTKWLKCFPRWATNRHGLERPPGASLGARLARL